jgi:uncharacterized membrane protein HdeD (DUF308 family)
MAMDNGAAPTIEEARMAESLVTHTWRWILARGVLLILLGIFALLAPGFALFTFALVFAAYSFVDGVLALVAGVRAARHDGRRWGAMLLSGLAGVAIGVLFALFPLVSTVAYALLIVWLVAAWAAITGVLEIAAAIRLRRAIEGEWLLGLAGALSVLLGAALVWLLFASPAATLLSVAWLIAIYAVISGVALIALGVRMRRKAAG